MLAWMLARTDQPLIVQMAIVIGGTSRIEQRIAEALLGHVSFRQGRWKMAESRLRSGGVGEELVAVLSSVPAEMN